MQKEEITFAVHTGQVKTVEELSAENLDPMDSKLGMIQKSLNDFYVETKFKEKQQSNYYECIY